MKLDTMQEMAKKQRELVQTNTFIPGYPPTQESIDKARAEYLAKKANDER
jgi:coenzyme F420-reducing hydrogenase gamma subunit